jgi:hypothetical protein
MRHSPVEPSDILSPEQPSSAGIRAPIPPSVPLRVLCGSPKPYLLSDLTQSTSEFGWPDWIICQSSAQGRLCRLVLGTQSMEASGV